jgi:DNA-binding NarL/FixJ family response regulator
MRIVIAEDHAIVREGLKALLEEQTDKEVVGEADNGEEVVKLVGQLMPDVVIMDIAMPKLNGVEAIRQIREHYPSVKTIVLSMHSEHTIVTEALKAGCDGYVLKSSLFEEISLALDVMDKGEHYLSPEITSVVVEGYLDQNSGYESRGLHALTSRERQVLQLVAEGLSTKDIGRHLHINPKTADATRRHIMHKLDLYTVADLTKFAIREGLTSMEL